MFPLFQAPLFFAQTVDQKTKMMGDELISAIDSTMEHLNRGDGHSQPPMEYPSTSSKTEYYEKVSLNQLWISNCGTVDFH